MKMTLWKEVREQWLKVLGAAAVLFAIEAYALGVFNLQQPPEDGGAGFLTASAFGCPLLGLALALAQFLPELRRDRWASLLHLPVARNVYFQQRMLAGLLLYLVAVGIPYLACVVLAAVPGVIAAPFTPQIPVAGAVNIGAGVLFYLGALAGLWQTRRGFLLRALPGVAALLLGLLCLGLPDFEAAVLGLVGSISLLGLACFYVARHQGSAPPPPWVFRAAMTTVIAIGLLGPVIIGVYLTAILSLFSMHREGGSWSRWMVDPALGGPVRMYSSERNVLKKIMKPDGTILPVPPEQLAARGNDYGAAADFDEVCGAVTDPTYHDFRQTFTFRERNDYVLQAPPRWYRNSDSPMVIWYYLREARIFVAYGWETRRAAAYLGVNGGGERRDQVTPFPEDTQPIYLTLDAEGLYLWSQETLYYASFQSRQTRAVVSDQGRIVNAITTRLYDLGAPPHVERAVTVATTRSLIIVPADNNTRVPGESWRGGAEVVPPGPSRSISLPYTRDVASRGRISLACPRAVNAGGRQFYVRYSPTAIRPSQLETTNDDVELMDEKGRVLSNYTLLHAWAAPEPPDSLPLVPALAAGIVAPPALVGMGFLLGNESWPESDRPTDPNRIGNSAGMMPLVGAMLVSSGLFAAATFALARRRGLPTRCAWRWSAFVPAMNLVGFVAFLIQVPRPFPVACPSCRKKRPAQGETCPHCGQAWPPPGPSGAEIFDDQQTATAEALAIR